MVKKIRDLHQVIVKICIKKPFLICFFHTLIAQIATKKKNKFIYLFKKVLLYEGPILIWF